MSNVAYKPPFPYFGGKSAVADVVWAALGDVENYVEPFCGSAAVLLLRPGGAGRIETVNDADGLLANFWRALQKDSDAVAEYADWPVNECDLHARHLWLIGRREDLTARLCGDPDYCDAKAAGWWVWGACCWIAGGWCTGSGPWISENGEMVLRDGGSGVHRKLPHLGDGRGVHRQLPHLGDGLGDAPATSAPGRSRLVWLREYLGAIADRLRGVRVCCGDWARVCGPSVTFVHGTTGVFLDPPYSDSAGRDFGLYAKDCMHVAHAVREWAIEQGKNPLMRIALAGYEGEHEMPEDWRCHEWEARGGYLGRNGAPAGHNRTRERLWFSPACLVAANPQRRLFDESH